MGEPIRQVMIRGQLYGVGSGSDDMIATVEPGSRSQNNYSVGEHLIWQGSYYSVIATIHENDLLTVDTNIQKDTVSNEIETINASLTELDDNLTASDNHKFEFMTDGDGNYGYRGADDSFVPFSSVDLEDLESYAHVYYDSTTAGPVAYNFSSRELTLKSGFKKGVYLLLNGNNGIWQPTTIPSGISIRKASLYPNGTYVLYVVTVYNDIVSDTVIAGSSGVGSYMGFDFYTIDAPIVPSQNSLISVQLIGRQGNFIAYNSSNNACLVGNSTTNMNGVPVQLAILTSGGYTSGFQVTTTLPFQYSVLNAAGTFDTWVDGTSGGTIPAYQDTSILLRFDV